MSLTFNMVGQKNFGPDAILMVTVPTGALVIAEKDNFILTPHIWNRNSKSAEDYALFIIPANTFDDNEWIVTMTLNNISVIKTIIINTNHSYQMQLYYHVPTDYQEVEYLESTGTQYIKLPISSNNIASGKIQFYIVTSVNYAFAFGSSLDSTGSTVSGSYGLRISTTGTQGFQYNTTTTGLSVSTTSLLYDVSFATTSGSQTYVVNDVSTSASVTGTISNSQTYLFTFNYNSNIKSAELSKIRIYYFVCYNNNNEKILEIYPCYRKSDSVAGMWDDISKEFLINAGSGIFLVGGDI